MKNKKQKTEEAKIVARYINSCNRFINALKKKIKNDSPNNSKYRWN